MTQMFYDIGDVIISLLGLDIEPFPYKDPEVLQANGSPDSESLCASQSFYDHIRCLYQNAALLSEQKRKAEAEGAKIEEEELRSILKRTSIHSLLQRHCKNDEPINTEVEETSISMDVEDPDIPSEFRERSLYKFHYIAPTDTLEGLALQHSIRVSELKRINNIHKNQDFYALSCIRVPNCIQVSSLTFLSNT